MNEYKEEENRVHEKASKHPKAAKGNRRAHRLSKGPHMQNVPKGRRK